MTRKLWLDDVRPAPNPQWEHVTTAGEAIAVLSAAWEQFDEVSLDHDLGEGVPTGYAVACYIEEQVAKGKTPPHLMCHSDNPPGAKRIRAAFDSIANLVARRSVA